MGMTFASAKTYVAKILGGQNDANMLTASADAINAVAARWNNDKDWTFLLKDTATTFSVASCIVTGSTSVAPTTPGDLDGVNIGATVTGGSPISPQAGTTVIAYTRDSRGRIATLTLSLPASNGTGTLTFSGDIPLISGTQEYNLPNDFGRPYSARLITNKRPLEYIKYREVNRKVADQTASGVPSHYTSYNPVSTATQQHTRLRLFRIPSNSDTLRVQYYRSINTAETNIDVIDDFLYVFLDEARIQLLKSKNAGDDRLPALQVLLKEDKDLIRSADEEESSDEDLRLISQIEAPPTRPINYVDINGDIFF